MRMTDRRRAGGVAAVAAAFWLGFVCGGGGSLPGAAAIEEPSGQPPRPPAPASPDESAPVPGEPAPQPPDEPAPQSPEDPASQPPEDPASQPPEDPAPAPEDPVQPAAVPGEEPAQADPVPDESTPADPEAEDSTEPDPEADAPPGPEPPLVQDRPREFTARTGVLLYFVRQDGENAFEETLARVAEAFAASESEERRRQADGWSTYKAEEPLADGARLYVSWIDPAVPGADYWVPGILNEAFPTEAQALYETYAGAFADGQILLNLVPVAGP